jgi:hypothetical protein
VVAPLGADRAGNVLNINADTIASMVSAAMPAEKLFLLTNVGGVLGDIDDPSSRISYLTESGAESLLGWHGSGDHGGDGVGVDVEHIAGTVGSQRRDHGNEKIIEKDIQKKLKK